MARGVTPLRGDGLGEPDAVLAVSTTWAWCMSRSTVALVYDDAHVARADIVRITRAVRPRRRAPDAAAARAADLTATGDRGFPPDALVAGAAAGCAAPVSRLRAVGFDSVVVRPAAPDPAVGAASIARFRAEIPALLEEP
jgi:hypothetical protein